MLQLTDHEAATDGVPWLPAERVGPSTSRNWSAAATESAGRSSWESPSLKTMESLARANLTSISVSDWLNSVDDPAATSNPNEDIKSPGTKIRTVQWDAQKHESPLKSEAEMSRGTSNLANGASVREPTSTVIRQPDGTLVVNVPVKQGMTCCARVMLSLASALVSCPVIALLSDKDGKWVLYCILLVVVTELCFLYWAVKTPHPHQRLVITPIEFHLHKTARYNDQPVDIHGNNKEMNSEAEVSFIDHLFWKQISGHTSNLKGATVREKYGPDGEAIHVLALQEGSEEHILGTSFSAEEVVRLTFEINTVLFEFQNANHPIPDTP